MLKKITILLGCLFPLVTHAVSPAEELVAVLSDIKTVQAKYSQEIIDHEGLVLQKTQGEFVLARPGKMYWKTAPPYEQLIVGNGEKIWVYDPDLEQVEIHSAGDQMQTPMSLLTSSADTLVKNYAITEQKSETEERFSLAPIDANGAKSQGAFAELQFVFEKGLLTEISLFDKLRQETKIRLSGVVHNETVAEEMFDFVAPEGVDIVTQ